MYRRTVTDSGLLQVLLPPYESELGREGGVRDEGGDQGMAASPSDAAPACPALWVGLGGGTHPQKTSMATSPARRMAKRMEKMVVMAIMPALCPLSVVEMLLGDLAGERAGGEGAGCRDKHPGVAQGVWMGDGVFVCANTMCHHTVPPYTSETRGRALPQFPQLLIGTLTPNHSCLAFSPLGPPHTPRTTPYPPSTAAGWVRVQEEHPGSGTCPQHDGLRPVCLSHGLRALQGEELHPGMGREVGHGAVSREAAGSP